MKVTCLALFLIVLASAARAEPWAGPIFDAHLHYNVEAVETVSVGSAFELFRKSGVAGILANSRPNDGTRALYEAWRKNPAIGVQVVPFIRVYRNRDDYGTWMNNREILAMIVEEQKRGFYKGIGEFHVHGRAADTPVLKEIVDFSVAKGLILHAHCDDEALEILYAHNPKAQVIWAHTGFGTPLARVEELLRKYPGLWGELSYRSGIADSTSLSAEWKALFARHPMRFLLGSDTWVNERWASYPSLMSGYRRLLGELPREIAARIAWGNAAALFEMRESHAAGVQPAHISGTVTSSKGPEAGVWVIAETTELPTRFARIVVTDAKGRYLIPDLPNVGYSVWVRGYGLVDSPKIKANPGRALDLTAVPAPNEAAAAHYYPAIYWYSMMKLPKPEDFGGKGGIPANVTQKEWMSSVKNIACIGCHQLGQESTRTLPAAFSHIKSSEEAWMRRVMSGQSGQQMITQLGERLGGAPFQYYADWTDRIAKGELPFAKPKRPEGMERNIVVTWWEWSQPEKYLHDLISSDRRDPKVNAHGPLYGSPEYSTDNMPILDPRTHKVTSFKLPVRDADTPESLGPGHAASEKPLQPSPYWGEAKTWDTKANNHNAMLDRQGRVWLAATVRAPSNPDFCKKGSDHPSAKVAPLERNNRQLAVLDPKTMKYTFVDTCFGTHHLQFDAQDRVWTSGAQVAAWVDTKVFDETGDAAKAQRWMPLVTANGQRLEGYGTYAVMPNIVDGSVWYTARIFAGGGVLLRFDPKTELTEIFNVPAPGYAARGADIDKQGVVWVSLGSGHLGSFDRRKCKSAECSEGWSFHKYPGPGFRGIGENSAESSYYTWVDQHDTFGLGEDVPISTGNLNDGLIAYAGGKMIVLRVPYPMGFYAKGLDGRIDDPKAGWKGRGLWTTSGDRAPWLREGGKGSLPIAVQIQYRPNPLAP